MPEIGVYETPHSELAYPQLGVCFVWSAYENEFPFNRKVCGDKLPRPGDSTTYTDVTTQLVIETLVSNATH